MLFLHCRFILFYFFFVCAFCGSALCNLFLTPLSAHVFCLFLVKLANDVSSMCLTSFSSLSFSLSRSLTHTRLARFLNDKIQEIFGVGLCALENRKSPRWFVSKVVKPKRHWNSIFENASALCVRLAMTFMQQLPNQTRPKPQQTRPLDVTRCP